MATIPIFALPNNPREIVKRRILLEQLSDFEIKKNCGLDFQGVNDILDIFEPIEGATSRAIPLESKVITFLSYLRSGNFQWSLGTLSGTSQPSVSRIINDCVNCVLNTAKDNIVFGTSPQSIINRKENFQLLANPVGFPRVLGVVDGTHVGIISPRADEDRYVNRKGYHSINCQVVADANQCFLDIVAKWPGATHDSFIWRNSSVKRRLQRGELGTGWFLGNLTI